MKKTIFLAVSMLAFCAGAQTKLEDVTVVVFVQNYDPVIVAGAPAVAATAAPVVYDQPVVYNAPAVYLGPVIYNGPVVYNTQPQYASQACVAAYTPAVYSYYPAHPCNSYFYNPNLIRFGYIQAAREGYHFNHWR